MKKPGMYQSVWELLPALLCGAIGWFLMGITFAAVCGAR